MFTKNCTKSWEKETSFCPSQKVSLARRKPHTMICLDSKMDICKFHFLCNPLIGFDLYHLSVEHFTTGLILKHTFLVSSHSPQARYYCKPYQKEGFYRRTDLTENLPFIKHFTKGQILLQTFLASADTFSFFVTAYSSCFCRHLLFPQSPHCQIIAIKTGVNQYLMYFEYIIQVWKADSCQHLIDGVTSPKS